MKLTNNAYAAMRRDDTNTIHIIRLTAKWCPTCKDTASAWRAFTRKAGVGVKCWECDIDEDVELGALFHVEYVPTTIIIRQGRIVRKRTSDVDYIKLLGGVR